MAYIKKPPNAFMLFLEEQRPYVAPELRRQGTSKVNKALGKKVSVFKKLVIANSALEVFHNQAGEQSSNPCTDLCFHLVCRVAFKNLKWSLKALKHNCVIFNVLFLVQLCL